MTPAVPVFGNHMYESASKFGSFFQHFVVQQAIKISLVRSHSCAFVFQTFFLVEITFFVIVPFSEVHLRILFSLFAVLEKHGAAP